MKLRFAALLALIASLPAMAYDCSDYLQWDLSSRVKAVERRLGYYKFNPSYYENVPVSWAGVQYHAEKLCSTNDYKSKNIDDVFDEAAIKEGMKRR